MDESSLKPNSFKSKNPIQEKEDDHIIDSPTKVVQTKKRSVLRQIGDILVNQNNESIADYVVNNVLIPSVKNMWADALISIIELIFGTRRPISGSSTKTNYTKFSSGSAKPAQSSIQEPERYAVTKKQDFEEVIFENRWEAEDVLDNLISAIMEYGSVNIADYYELINMPSNFTDNKYGWTNLANAAIERVGGGYLLKLPPTVKLD